MAHAPRPLLPVRDGVSASCVAVPAGPWPTLLDFMAARLPALTRDEWARRFALAEVLNDAAQPLRADDRPHPGQRLHYYRRLDDEPAAPESETLVFQDEHLVVADKPHFMPVTPSGRFVQRSLLVRLRRRLGLGALSPIHRIDRDTAGLVVFAVQPDTRAVYQALFRDRQMHKAYEAIAPYRPALPFPRTHRSRIAPHPERFFISHEVAGEPNSETQLACLHTQGHLAHYGLRPVTGQRHQLRIHLAALGLPIEGDAFYPRVRHGPEAADDTARPLQLLARAIAFADPVTGAARHFVSRRRLQLAWWPTPDPHAPDWWTAGWPTLPPTSPAPGLRFTAGQPLHR